MSPTTPRRFAQRKARAPPCAPPLQVPQTSQGGRSHASARRAPLHPGSRSGRVSRPHGRCRHGPSRRGDRGHRCRRSSRSHACARCDPSRWRSRSHRTSRTHRRRGRSAGRRHGRCRVPCRGRGRCSSHRHHGHRRRIRGNRAAQPSRFPRHRSLLRKSGRRSSHRCARARRPGGERGAGPGAVLGCADAIRGHARPRPPSSPTGQRPVPGVLRPSGGSSRIRDASAARARPWWPDRPPGAAHRPPVAAAHRRPPCGHRTGRADRPVRPPDAGRHRQTPVTRPQRSAGSRPG